MERTATMHTVTTAPLAPLTLAALLALSACNSGPKQTTAAKNTYQLAYKLHPSKWTTFFEHPLVIRATEVVREKRYDDETKSSYRSRAMHVAPSERFRVSIGLDGLILKGEKKPPKDSTIREGDSFTFYGKRHVIDAPKEPWEAVFPLPNLPPVGQLAPTALLKKEAVAFKEVEVEGVYEKRGTRMNYGDRQRSWFGEDVYQALPLKLKLRFYYGRAVGEALKASYPDKPLRFSGETEATPLQRAMLQITRTGKVRKIYGEADAIWSVKYVGLEKEAKFRTRRCGSHKGRRVFAYISGYQLLVKERRSGKVLQQATLWGGGGCPSVVTRYGSAGAWGSHSGVSQRRRDAWFRAAFRKLK